MAAACPIVAVATPTSKSLKPACTRKGRVSAWVRLSLSLYSTTKARISSERCCARKPTNGPHTASRRVRGGAGRSSGSGASQLTTMNGR